MQPEDVRIVTNGYRFKVQEAVKFFKYILWWSDCCYDSTHNTLKQAEKRKKEILELNLSFKKVIE